MDALTFRLDHEATPPVLSIDGDVDIATADLLRDELASALEAEPRLVVDMDGVQFIDAAGIRAVLGVAATLNGAGPLRFVHAQRLAWLLDVAGLHDLRTIQICDDVASS
jgi:anti-anti-sigma factor